MKSARPIFWTLLRIAVSAALLDFAFRSIPLRDVAAILGRVRWSALTLPLAALTLLTVAGGIRWAFLMRSQGMAIPFRSAVELTFIGLFMNTFMMGSSGGDLFKAYFVAKNAPSRSAAAVSVLVDRLMGIVGLFLLAAGVLLLRPGDPRLAGASRVVALSLAGILAAVALFYSRTVRRLVRWESLMRRLPLADKLRKIDEAALGYRQHPKTVWSCMAASIAIHAVYTWAHFAYARALGAQQGTLSDFLVLVPVITAVRAVPIGWMGLGISEMTFKGFLAMVGIPGQEAIALSLLMLASTFAIGLIGGVLLLLNRHQVEFKDLATTRTPES